MMRVLLLGLWSVACTVHAQEPARNGARADRVRALQRQIRDLESIGRARVLRERGVKQRLRPAPQAAYNVESFTPRTARFLRFNVLATVSGDEPCLDALEIYGPDSSTNLTATEGVRLTASSVFPGHLGDFKDGRYGPGWCWVGKVRGSGWVQVKLPAPAKVARVVWSRDAQNRYHDRFATVYKVEVSEDGRAWETVATGEDRAAPGHDHGISRSAQIRALDASQRQKRQELLAELRRLGAPAPNVVKSGPQVGEGISGGFGVRGLNGSLGGRNFCPV